MTDEPEGAGSGGQDPAWPGDRSGLDPETGLPTRSTRDPARTRAALEAWLRRILGEGADARITAFDAPETNGMSSETVLFDAEWSGTDGRASHPLVARIAPDPTAVPVFPRYDLDAQARIMRLVATETDVPVPEVRWSEPDPSPLGAPFFVMERIDGVAPPDILPYTFDSWVTRGTDAERLRLQDATVRVLAAIHGLPRPEEQAAFVAPDTEGDTPLRRHVADQRAYYEWVVADGLRSPLIERGFEWLDDHWPDAEGPTVLLWGDARIGNVLYREFEPVAVLDWEMAALGPPEVDVAWLVTLHRFFQEIAETLELPGVPALLRRDDVVAQYEQLTGYAPRDLDFYTCYASLRHAIIMFRIARRAIHFGEAVQPDDVDDMITHRTMFEAMLAGTYWAHLAQH